MPFLGKKSPRGPFPLIPHLYHYCNTRISPTISFPTTPDPVLNRSNRRGDRTAIPGVSLKPTSRHKVQGRGLCHVAFFPSPSFVPFTVILVRRCPSFSLSSFPSFTPIHLKLVSFIPFPMIFMPFQNTEFHF